MPWNASFLFIEANKKWERVQLLLQIGFCLQISFLEFAAL